MINNTLNKLENNVQKVKSATSIANEHNRMENFNDLKQT